MADPIPAATLVLMRPGADAPELLAMQRASGMAFAAGAYVFPGGRIEDDDRRLADRIGSACEHAAARIAAIRETIEEVGIAAGFAEPPDGVLIAELRARLGRGEPFSELVAQRGLTLDLDALTPFAHWCPAHRESRRYDTIFFIAEAPANSPKPSADELEAVHSLWASAHQILAEADAGRMHIIFPTRRNLERLAQFATVEQARAHAAGQPLHKVIPWIEQRDGADWLCIPEAIGYPITAEPLGTSSRG